MKQIKCEALTPESYRWIGSYADLPANDSPGIGSGDVVFYRDIVTAAFSNKHVAFSICACDKRPMIIKEAEQHFSTAEGVLPLDGDVVVFAGESTNKTVPFDKLRAYYVPKGTLVTFGAGVWHMAPFPVKDEHVNTLVVLPPRTYANDCYVVPFDEKDYIEIVL